MNSHELKDHINALLKKVSKFANEFKPVDVLTTTDKKKQDKIVQELLDFFPSSWPHGERYKTLKAWLKGTETDEQKITRTLYELKTMIKNYYLDEVEQLLEKLTTCEVSE
ncbi:MAG: hypothetical protein R6U96_14630 [Promethearchaeia archaeon]